MRVEAVSSRRGSATFRAYCADRRADHDESFLSDFDLSRFRPVSPGTSEPPKDAADFAFLLRIEAADLVARPSGEDTGPRGRKKGETPDETTRAEASRGRLVAADRQTGPIDVDAPGSANAEGAGSAGLPGSTARGVALSPGTVIGALSLMIGPERRNAGVARIRIFHIDPALASELGPWAEAEGYGLLLAAGVAALAPLGGFSSAYGFLPEGAMRAAAIWQALGFRELRRSWLLRRDLAGLPRPEWPAEGYALAAFRPGRDEKDWCDVVNRAFVNLGGHVELTEEGLARLLDPSSAIPGGMLILRAAGRPPQVGAGPSPAVEGPDGSAGGPGAAASSGAAAVGPELAVGLVSVERDLEEPPGVAAFLGPLALRPDWQGRGLGRALLRAGMAAAAAAGCREIRLSVNAENEGAVRLYTAEGYSTERVMVCWSVDLGGRR